MRILWALFNTPGGSAQARAHLRQLLSTPVGSIGIQTLPGKANEYWPQSTGKSLLNSPVERSRDNMCLCLPGDGWNWWSGRAPWCQATSAPAFHSANMSYWVTSYLCHMLLTMMVLQGIRLKMVVTANTSSRGLLRGNNVNWELLKLSTLN